MITDWIGRHVVLLPINQNYDKIQQTNKASIERWTILKRCYDCWKPKQFTQQSAQQKRAKSDAYCPITSMTCATVLLMLKSGCWYPITFENLVIVLFWFWGILALGRFVRTSLCSVRTATTSGQYSPVQPSHSDSKRLIIIEYLFILGSVECRHEVTASLLYLIDQFFNIWICDIFLNNFHSS